MLFSYLLGGLPQRWTLALALVNGGLGPVTGRPVVARAQPPATPTPLVFDGVTVIDVQQGGRLPAQRVVIVGNRIRAMGSVRTVQIPRGARVVNARGKYLIPGLWDMHVHPSQHHETDFFYTLFIANGVTGIRDAGAAMPLDTMLQWRREIVAGARVGPPRQILSGPAIDEARPCRRVTGGWIETIPFLGKMTSNGHTCVADTADARHMVDSLKADGADMIKMYDLGKNLYFVIAAEARRVGIPFGGHVKNVTVLEASDSGASIVDHIASVDGDSIDGSHPHNRNERCWGASATVARCQPAVERFKRNGTWLVPTLVVYHESGQVQTQQLFTRFTKHVAAFQNHALSHDNWLHDSASASTPATSPPGSLDGMRIMQRLGMPILAGTDAARGDMFPGFSLHAELAMYVTEGLTPLEALQAATLNPAKFLHATDSLGTVAPGKLADLVLLDADPLADITNTTTIRAVVANGRYFDRVALDQLLADAQAKGREP